MSEAWSRAAALGVRPRGPRKHRQISRRPCSSCVSSSFGMVGTTHASGVAYSHKTCVRTPSLSQGSPRSLAAPKNPGRPVSTCWRESDRKREGPDVPGPILSRKRGRLSPCIGDLNWGAENGDWCCGVAVALGAYYTVAILGWRQFWRSQ